MIFRETSSDLHMKTLGFLGLDDCVGRILPSANAKVKGKPRSKPGLQGRCLQGSRSDIIDMPGGSAAVDKPYLTTSE